MPAAHAVHAPHPPRDFAHALPYHSAPQRIACAWRAGPDTAALRVHTPPPVHHPRRHPRRVRLRFAYTSRVHVAPWVAALPVRRSPMRPHRPPGPRARTSHAPSHARARVRTPSPTLHRDDVAPCTRLARTPPARRTRRRAGRINARPALDAMRPPATPAHPPPRNDVAACARPARARPPRITFCVAALPFSAGPRAAYVRAPASHPRRCAMTWPRAPLARARRLRVTICVAAPPVCAHGHPARSICDPPRAPRRRNPATTAGLGHPCYAGVPASE